MPRRGRRSGAAERGFALLVVLWWTALLALLGTQLLATGRLQAQRAGNLRSAAAARAAADGVVQEAVFHLLDGSPAGWAADGAPHVVPVPGGMARVEIRSEAGKVGLNQASPGLLAALLTRLGTSPHEAAALADAILDWRTATPRRRALGAKASEYRAAGQDYGPPGSDFETLDELRLVRGMTPDILARLAPFVSVYQFGDPDLLLADAVVRLASAESGDVEGEAAQGAGAPGTAPVVTVAVLVEMASGARAARRTVVRLALDAARRPFQILDGE